MEGKATFFGVAWHATEKECREYLREFDVPYQTGLDKTEKIFRAYGWTYQPATVFVTRSGRIFKKQFGAIDERKLRAIVDELILQP